MMIDEPEIEVELNLVTIAEGYNTELTCTVHGEPKPTVFWTKNGERLDSTGALNSPHHRYVQTSTGSRHVLSIDNVQTHDFANYTCHGENRFGRDHKTIEMTGKLHVCCFLTNWILIDFFFNQQVWPAQRHWSVTNHWPMVLNLNGSPSVTHRWWSTVFVIDALRYNFVSPDFC